MREGVDLQVLRALSPAYAGRNGELTAILQYVYQSVCLGGTGREKEAKQLLSIAVDEMRHLEKIGKLLVLAGVSPVFTACPPYPVAYYSAANVDYSRPLSEMIGADIRGEREAIACYDRILAVIREDPIRTVIGEIRSDEERHLALLEEMRSSL